MPRRSFTVFRLLPLILGCVLGEDGEIKLFKLLSPRNTLAMRSMGVPTEGGGSAEGGGMAGREDAFCRSRNVGAVLMLELGKLFK